MESFDIIPIFMMLAYAAIVVGVCWAIVQIVKAICNAITKGIEIRTFGSSEAYKEFLQWKKERF